MPLASPELIDLVPEPLRALLQRHELRLRRPIAGLRHGSHRSSRVGGGHDFHEHRAYSPGDDPRQLDWRAAARRERLVMRQHEGAEQLALVLAIDASAGMGYEATDGSRRKWATAVGFAATIAALALGQGDRVGAALGRDGACALGLLRPSGSRDRLRALAHELRQAPRGRCDWRALIAGIRPALPRRSLVVVLGDFLDPDPARPDADEWLTHELARLAAHGHELLLLQILDRDEVEFPWRDGRVRRFEDSRDARDPVEGAAASLRASYLDALAAHQRGLVQRCESSGLLLHTVVAGRDELPHSLLALLERLAGGRPHARVYPEIAAAP